MNTGISAFTQAANQAQQWVNELSEDLRWDDRRAYRVYPTAPAQPMLAKLHELADEHAREAFAGFSEDELVQLDALLNALARNIGRGQD